MKYHGQLVKLIKNRSMLYLPHCIFSISSWPTGKICEQHALLRSKTSPKFLKLISFAILVIIFHCRNWEEPRWFADSLLHCNCAHLLVFCLVSDFHICLTFITSLIIVSGPWWFHEIRVFNKSGMNFKFDLLF